MYYRNQRACRVQPLSAELILWITGDVWQNDTKMLGSVHILSPHHQKVRRSGPQDLHRIAAIAYYINRCICFMLIIHLYNFVQTCFINDNLHLLLFYTI